MPPLTAAPMRHEIGMDRQSVVTFVIVTYVSFKSILEQLEISLAGVRWVAFIIGMIYENYSDWRRHAEISRQLMNFSASVLQ